ncbi:hypothetical protein [Pseudomonas sp. MWU12-2345]|uniref:hypothetical protein n=1 Tax=Pseudomonas sp. MWU12-2345 TaxID=2928689 RepID=UPI00200D99F6|nr:hypothetical protein [Pseudomonas sp. MWU12-2345]
MDKMQAGLQEIFNFEHGISTTREIPFGPYRIHIEKNPAMDEAFVRGVRTTYSTEIDECGEIQNIVTTLPANPGSWSPTATVEEHQGLGLSSVLFPDIPVLNGAYDLALILSFLTGRHVVVGNDAKPFLPLTPAQSVVSGNYFYHPNINWSALAGLSELGVGEAMDAACTAMTNSNLLIKMSLGASALDRLVSGWHNKSGGSRFTKEVKLRVKDASKAFEKHLIEAGEDPAIVQDLLARIPNLGNDSALAKLKNFLCTFEMYPIDASEEIFSRLKLFNIQRNAVAHSASVRFDSAEKFEDALRVAGAISVLILTICRVYVSKYLLSIDDKYGIDIAQQAVRTFFEKGTFNEQAVFTEDYDSYMQRVADRWVASGGLE